MPYDNPITVHCSTCGSQDVRADAYAAWNPELQTWELVAIFDSRDCEDCGGECSTVEKEIAR
ncbi:MULTISPECIES: hypothetical protein [Roseobacteraceae]|uniref:hypothetical protein n=1 Tax=Roseobacteraceae TaxID=2854170 RepID=UPI0022CB6AC6|nr:MULTISPECIES: hypothetical protein [Roseobacteraceae]MCZ4354901.1 hypothetical protein [Roseovarius aestuarii]